MEYFKKHEKINDSCHDFKIYEKVNEQWNTILNSISKHCLHVLKNSNNIWGVLKYLFNKLEFFMNLENTKYN